jgi:peroxiredoxin
VGVADSNKMKTGTAAPDFQNLPGVDGKTYSLKDFSADAVLVVIFSCNHCPYVQAYEDRLMALQREFAGKGVRFVAINSNDATSHPDDSFDNMVRRAKERQFNFLYLRDESQIVARAFGATHTPHLFVFDRERRLRYTGRVDDNWQDPSKVTKLPLHDALSALTSGQTPPEAETFAIGCTIKWKS